MKTIFRLICTSKNPSLAFMSFGFWMGVFCHGAFLMFYQDALGLEAYLAKVEEGWVDLHWLVGGSLLAFGVTLYTSVRRRMVAVILSAKEEMK